MALFLLFAEVGPHLRGRHSGVGVEDGVEGEPDALLQHPLVDFFVVDVVAGQFFHVGDRQHGGVIEHLGRLGGLFGDCRVNRDREGGLFSLPGGIALVEVGPGGAAGLDEALSDQFPTGHTDHGLGNLGTDSLFSLGLVLVGENVLFGTL